MSSVRPDGRLKNDLAFLRGAPRCSVSRVRSLKLIGLYHAVKRTVNLTEKPKIADRNRQFVEHVTYCAATGLRNFGVLPPSRDDPLRRRGLIPGICTERTGSSLFLPLRI